MTRTWQDNAHEFGALTRQGKDIRLALLVACSVERGTGQGARTQPRRDRAEVKISATEFARQGGTNKDRILRHLDAWDRLAQLSHVPPAAELGPDDVDTVRLPYAATALFIAPFHDDATGEQTGVFDASKSGGRPRASAKEIAKGLAEKPDLVTAVVEAMTPDERTAFSEKVAESVPQPVRARASAEEIADVLVNKPQMRERVLDAMNPGDRLAFGRKVAAATDRDPTYQAMERNRREREAREFAQRGRVIEAIGIAVAMATVGERELAKIKGKEFTWTDGDRELHAQECARARAVIEQVEALPSGVTSDAIYEGLGL